MKLALPAGLAPASVRLEDERLVYFGHGSGRNWSARQDLHLRSLGPRPSVLAATLRAERPRRLTTPGRRNAELQPWKRSCGKIRNWWRGQESHLPETVYEPVLCTLVEFPAMKWWRPTGNAPVSACLQSRCITFLPRPQELEIGKPPWCCPRQAEFWRLCCTGWCAA